MAAVSGLMATVWEFRELRCRPVDLMLLTTRPCLYVCAFVYVCMYVCMYVCVCTYGGDRSYIAPELTS